MDRYVPRNPTSVQYKIWKLVSSTPFEFLIMTVIALNTVCLMTKVRQLLISLLLYYRLVG